MEAGPGGQRHVPREPPGYLPCRAAPGRCPPAAHDDGVRRAPPPRSTHGGLARHHCRAAHGGRVARTFRRDDVRSGHSLRPRRGTPAARTPHARSRPGRPNGPLRVFTLLHDAQPVLLNLGEPGSFDITPWADRVQLIDAKYTGAFELPAIG